MTLKKMIVTAVATIMVSTLGATNYYDPCCKPCPQDCSIDLCCDPCGGWSVYADYFT